jgi:hypothetical protein
VTRKDGEFKLQFKNELHLKNETSSLNPVPYKLLNKTNTTEKPKRNLLFQEDS